MIKPLPPQIYKAPGDGGAVPRTAACAKPEPLCFSDGTRSDTGSRNRRMNHYPMACESLPYIVTYRPFLVKVTATRFPLSRLAMPLLRIRLHCLRSAYISLSLLILPCPAFTFLALLIHVSICLYAPFALRFSLAHLSFPFLFAFAPYMGSDRSAREKSASMFRPPDFPKP